MDNVYSVDWRVSYYMPQRKGRHFGPQDCNIFAYFDGACGPVNPSGHMGFGAIVIDEGRTVFEYSGFEQADKTNTNNVAEYIALENVLDYITANGYDQDKVYIFGDSKLVVNQMSGLWRIKQGYYVPHAIRCLEKFGQMRARIKWIPREENIMADDLSKQQFVKRGIISM